MKHAFEKLLSNSQLAEENSVLVAVSHTLPKLKSEAEHRSDLSTLSVEELWTLVWDSAFSIRSADLKRYYRALDDETRQQAKALGQRWCVEALAARRTSETDKRRLKSIALKISPSDLFWNERLYEFFNQRSDEDEFSFETSYFGLSFLGRDEAVELVDLCLLESLSRSVTTPAHLAAIESRFVGYPYSDRFRLNINLALSKVMMERLSLHFIDDAIVSYCFEFDSLLDESELFRVCHQGKLLSAIKKRYSPSLEIAALVRDVLVNDQNRAAAAFQSLKDKLSSTEISQLLWSKLEPLFIKLLERHDYLSFESEVWPAIAPLFLYFRAETFPALAFELHSPAARKVVRDFVPLHVEKVEALRDQIIAEYGDPDLDPTESWPFIGISLEGFLATAEGEIRVDEGWRFFLRLYQFEQTFLSNEGSQQSEFPEHMITGLSELGFSVDQALRIIA